MKRGAGPAHRWCGKEDALTELPLVIRDSQGNFTADPQCVTEPLKDEDDIGSVKDINRKRALREKHVAEARVWVSSLGLRADDVRKACLSFPSTTAIGLDQHVFTDIALLTDNALDSLDEIIR